MGEQRRVPLHPPVHRDVIDFDAPRRTPQSQLPPPVLGNRSSGDPARTGEGSRTSPCPVGTLPRLRPALGSPCPGRVVVGLAPAGCGRSRQWLGPAARTRRDRWSPARIRGRRWVVPPFVLTRTEVTRGVPKARLRPRRGLKQLRSARIGRRPRARANLRRSHHEFATDATPPIRLAAAFTEFALTM